MVGPRRLYLCVDDAPVAMIVYGDNDAPVAMVVRGEDGGAIFYNLKGPNPERVVCRLSGAVMDAMVAFENLRPADIN